MKIKNTHFLVCLVFCLGIIGACSENISELNKKSVSKSNFLEHLEKTSEEKEQYLANLIAYKQSKHQIMVGYYRTWLDKATDKEGGATEMTQLPDSLDVVVVFRDYTPDSSLFWKTLKEKYIPYLHARGTKVLYTGSAMINPSDFPKDPHTNKNIPFSKLSKGQRERLCEFRALQIVARIKEYNFDGFDIDIEAPYADWNGKLSDAGAQIHGVMKALSSHLGPVSGMEEKLLTLDTNQEGDNALNKTLIPYVSYVFLQAYGKSPWQLDEIFASYKKHDLRSEQFVPGFSFYEEHSSNDWGDVHYPDDGKGTCYDYAKWQPNDGGKKGGIFAFAIDRDIPYKTDRRDAPNYAVTKKLIRVMNPSK